MSNTAIGAARRELAKARASLDAATTPAETVTAMARIEFAGLALAQADPDKDSGGGTFFEGVIVASALAPFFQSLAITLGQRLGAVIRWPSRRYQHDNEEIAWVAVSDQLICVSVPVDINDDARSKLIEFDFSALSATAEVFWDQESGDWLSRPLRIDRLPSRRSKR